MLTSLICRAVIYGVSDTNVYRLFLYTILPALLFVSLNVLFRLIKMYQYGVKIKQAEKDKKKEDCYVCFIS